MKKLYILTCAMAACSLVGNAANPLFNKVFEFVPAPGQFTNVYPEWESGDDADAIKEKAFQSMSDGAIICLGAYGGYVTVGFDHTVVNVAGERDFYIKGNAFTGNSEPGIVMVSYDINGNGLPDDLWFEIAGSEYNNSTLNYEITYVKPADDNADIAWSDNKGNTGFVYKNDFHSQPHWPQWIDSAELTFKGTRLPDNGKNTGTANQPYFVLSQYDYGYADNAPNYDGEQLNPDAMIDIDWAVDENGNTVKMPGVDFVRIYTGVNQYNGWIGECSTEVESISDQHADAQIDTEILNDFLSKYNQGSVREISNDDVRVYVDNSGTVRFALEESTTVRVFDQAGRECYVAKCEKGANSLELGDYPKGLYIVVIGKNATKILKK